MTYELTEARYLGSVCVKHPELNGLRQRCNRTCTACLKEKTRKFQLSEQHLEYRRGYAKTPEQHAKRSVQVRQRKQHISVHAAKDYGPADKALMLRMYELASAYRLLGLEYHVDHIVPLKGANASGLHVGCNLQLLPAKDNLSKGNRL